MSQGYFDNVLLTYFHVLIANGLTSPQHVVFPRLSTTASSGRMRGLPYDRTYAARDNALAR